MLFGTGSTATNAEIDSRPKSLVGIDELLTKSFGDPARTKGLHARAIE
jgi:hypothetical protein